MIKGIIFDLDNTLIDLMELKRQCVKASVDAMIDAGLNLEKEKAINIFHQMYMNHNVEDRKIFQKFLKKATGKVDIKMLCYAILAYRRVKAGFLIPYPEAKKTLINLTSKGIKLAIVSDAPRERAWLRICATHLDDFFVTIVTFDDTKEKKPSKKPFIKAIKKLKLKPEECLMVGDFPERDIKGAKELGMYTAFAKYGYDSINDIMKRKKSNVKADFVLEKIFDLVGVVDKVNEEE